MWTRNRKNFQLMLGFLALVGYASASVIGAVEKHLPLPPSRSSFIHTLDVIDVIPDERRVDLIDLLDDFRESRTHAMIDFMAAISQSPQTTEAQIADMTATAVRLQAIIDRTDRSFVDTEDWRASAKARFIAYWDSFSKQVSHCASGTDSHNGLTFVSYAIAHLADQSSGSPIFASIPTAARVARKAGRVIDRAILAYEDAYEVKVEVSRTVFTLLATPQQAEKRREEAARELRRAKTALKFAAIYGLRAADELYAKSLRRLVYIVLCVNWSLLYGSR